MLRLLAVCLLVLPLLGSLTRAEQPATPADLEFFEKKIRPLFAENCHACHGEKKQRAGLRLDSVAAIRKGGDRGPVLMPGEPEKSLLLHAVGYADVELRMPPKGKLRDEQIADLTTWIRKGAATPKEAGGAALSKAFDMAERMQHWAYQPVKLHSPPSVTNKSWPTAVDAFILAKLEAAGLSPSPPADRATLIRRLTFDLHGLPPTPAEVGAFAKDSSPDAEERLVERLLASPRYGERWGRHWLDLVRYAETLGHEFDYEIYNAWRYRDYAVRAFNEDVPYDQFVVEHLAGDLLTHPRRCQDGTNESIIGTASFWFCEGKHGPVDVRQEQADRIDNQIDVLSKAFLAQTIACARCHDHKFDAIPTRDYYALYGYLKSSRYQQAFIDPPEHTATLTKKLEELRTKIKRSLAASWRAAASQLQNYLLAAGEPSAQAKELDAALLERWRVALRHGDLKRADHPLHAWRLVTTTPAGKLSVPSDSAKPVTRNDHVLRFAAADGFKDWFPTGPAFGQRPTQSGELLVIAGATERSIRLASPGWAHSGGTSVRLEGELRSQTFTLDKPFIHIRTAGRGGRVNLVVDGFTIIRDPIYGGLTLEINQEAPHWRTMKVEMWRGRQAYLEFLDTTTPHPGVALPAEASAGRPGNAYLAVQEVLFSDQSNPPAPQSGPMLARLLRDAPTSTILAQRYAEELQALCDHWKANPEKELTGRDGLGDFVNWMLDEKLLSLEAASSLAGEHATIEGAIRAPRRVPALADGTGEDEVVFLRGNHKLPGERAPRRLMTAIAGEDQPPPAAGSGRLALAQRLVRADNPLFARVLVNRLWHHHFGKGLVRTPDDFGRMGEPPTHPELLDYLALEFVRQGYSLKAMHRLLLNSQVYRMSGGIDPRAAQVDPDNRLWHRMPVRRLEAESIRDAILAVSGQLDSQMEGPSVPPHLTPFMEGRGRPGHSGPLDGARRRSLYLQVRRNFLNPLFLAFDYPTPFSTIGRRTMSNVPAQALTLMNDPFVLEQSRHWAEGIARDPDTSTMRRLDRLYQTAFARSPTTDELEAGTAFIADQAARLGRSPGDPAVWADFCHVLLNTKEFVFVR